MLLTIRMTFFTALMAFYTLSAATPALASDTVTIGLSKPPHSFVAGPKEPHPVNGQHDTSTYITYGNVYETLTQMNADGLAQPSLATHWAGNSDATRWTFFIRRGVRFHNGERLTAEDIRLSLEAALNMPQAALSPTLSQIETVQKLDPITIEITLKRPNGDFPAALAHPDTQIGYRTLGFGQRPIGTGPYLMLNWDPDRPIELVGNSEHWRNGMPKVTTLRYISVPDIEERFSGLLNGAIDIVADFPALSLLANFEIDPRFNVVRGTTERELILAFNHKNQALKDRRLRKAITHAINRDKLIDEIYFGYATELSSHFPPFHPAAERLYTQSQYDPLRVDRLLKQVGPLAPIRLVMPKNTNPKGLSYFFRSQFEALKLPVVLEEIDIEDWREKVFETHDFDLTLVAFPNRQDITYYGRQKNFMGYKHPDLPSLANELVTTPDGLRRFKALRDMQFFLAKDHAAGFMVSVQRPHVVRSSLTGLHLSAPLNTLPLGNLRRK